MNKYRSLLSQSQVFGLSGTLGVNARKAVVGEPRAGDGCANTRRGTVLTRSCPARGMLTRRGSATHRSSATVSPHSLMIQCPLSFSLIYVVPKSVPL